LPDCLIRQDTDKQAGHKRNKVKSQSSHPSTVSGKRKWPKTVKAKRTGLTESPKFDTRGSSTMNKDLDHLKLLGILHTVWGILSIVLGLIFGLIYIGIGASTMASPNSFSEDSGISASAFGGIFIGVGIVALIVALIYGILLMMAGGKLRKQQGYGFCFFVAILDLLGFPSIILGIFTLIVLNRPTVKALFKGGSIPGSTAQAIPPAAS
jgi:ABC-type phosphate transport system permease subunit